MAETKKITNIRIQVVKGLLDLDPQVRRFTRDYLNAYYKPKRPTGIGTRPYWERIRGEKNGQKE